MERLRSKVAIVTGAGSGLGASIARLYAAEGARVVAVDVAGEAAAAVVAAIERAGGEAISIAADVADEAAVAAMVTAACDHFGGLHVMTANAGVAEAAAPKAIDEIAYEEYRRTLDVNLGGVLFCFKYATPAIYRSGGGAMTATTSLAAHRAVPARLLYSASKGAVVALVRSLAAALAPGIRVNAVSPGAMVTEMARAAAELGPGDPELEEDAMRADPSRVAHAHLYLASEEASFITGQTLIADGGWGLELGPRDTQPLIDVRPMRGRVG